MNENELMTTAAVSQYLGIAVSTLAMYRAAGVGPKYIKVLHRLVRYRRADVEQWLNTQEKATNSPEIAENPIKRLDNPVY
jgi:predicted DNA-binding transcriptional regulator AlpA